MTERTFRVVIVSMLTFFILYELTHQFIIEGVTMFEKIYIYEYDTQSYNLCDWCGEHKYCSEVTGKVYYV